MITFSKIELENILTLIANSKPTIDNKLEDLEDKLKFMVERINIKEAEKQKAILRCSSCKGEGEVEISAGSHSFFRECKCCKGTGLPKK